METHFRSIMSSSLGQKNYHQSRGNSFCLLHAVPKNWPSWWLSIPLAYRNIQMAFCQLCWLVITPSPILSQACWTAEEGLVRALSHSSDMISC